MKETRAIPPKNKGFMETTSEANRLNSSKSLGSESFHSSLKGTQGQIKARGLE